MVNLELTRQQRLNGLVSHCCSELPLIQAWLKLLQPTAAILLKARPVVVNCNRTHGLRSRLHAADWRASFTEAAPGQGPP